MSSQTDLPYIVILDWDGTIAGRVDFQSLKYSMTQQFKKFGIKAKNDNKIPKAFLPNQYLIRPGFANFMYDLSNYFNNNVYFFIYTASEKNWAYKEIQWVEKAHGVKFQRPIFTRDECVVDIGGNYRKSLSLIFPRILRSLGKHPAFTKQEKDEILQNRILIVDNNAVYNDSQGKLLICPHYHYTVFENLLEDIPAISLKNPAIKQYLLTLTNNGMLCPFFPNPDINHIMYKKYEWLALKCRAITDENKIYLKDNFFPYLTKLIVKNNLKGFSNHVIKQLQEAVWKKTEKKN